MSDLPVLIPLSKSSTSAPRPRLAKAEPLPLLPNFVAGPENRLAAFTCQSDLSILQRGNPILLVGPSGSGKSAIARKLFEREASLLKGRGSRGIIEPAIDFARRYADAVDSDSIADFRNNFLQHPILLIEDVHLMAGKFAAQNELAARIGQRIDLDLPTILTCRRLPTEIEGIRSALASRLLPGLTIPIQLPRSEARRQIIAQYAGLREISLTEEQIGQLDNDLPADAAASRLCSAVQQLALVAMDANSDVIANDDIHDVAASFAAQQEPPIAKIARTVARRFKLKTSDLKSSSRRQQVVRARSMAMFLGRQLTRQSLQAIGQFFGGRDHSTVIHAIRSAEQLIVSDPALARVADDVSEQLKAG
ncbi:Chromosomal replication initiator protein DnaA [Rosistilla oblonga]|uniref:Chromosomal replication initiator protein DnaA n=2 Tax=Rosistilla TaxID=2795779 RepID=A0A518ILT2_9BACT|nr:MULTISPECIES: helix-turn-helix domain-containing protein [Rosistilla]QDS85845.1 Chromosomal replication initiator protein DnaA [Rosistilla ulvae]QDV10161.1 Chromosomal replication initiator protein DnaA [Rosistilla oblonga]QDV54060.1 Chromosomal replication initiator protein DnaA [Rosistilla oblonga]